MLLLQVFSINVVGQKCESYLCKCIFLLRLDLQGLQQRSLIYYVVVRSLDPGPRTGVARGAEVTWAPGRVHRPTRRRRTGPSGATTGSAAPGRPSQGPNQHAQVLSYNNNIARIYYILNLPLSPFFYLLKISNYQIPHTKMKRGMDR